MAKFNFPINDFGSGEWSPRMLGRTNVEQYTRACTTIKNFIPQMSGGAAYRGGTKFVNINNSGTQAVMDGLVGGTLPDVKILSYTPFNKTYNKILLISGTDDWYILPNGTVIDKGTRVTAEANLITWTPSLTQSTQVGDLLVLVNSNGSHTPKVFSYKPLTNTFKIDNIDQDHVATKPWKTIPWGDVNALDTSVTLSINTATVGLARTLTASASFFVGQMVGTYIRLCNGTSVAGVVRITAVGGSTSATVDVLQVVPSAAFQFGATANATSFWQISAWNDYYGWPRTVTAFQGRLVYGGNSDNPDTIWGSRIGNYFDFEEVPEPNTTGSFSFASGSYLADNSRPFTLAPNSSEASNIYCLSSAKTLVINTDKSEIVAYGTQGALGPLDVVFESSTSFGAEHVQPVRVNNFLTFVQKGGRKIRDIVFNLNEDQFKSTDLAFVADHLFQLDGNYKDIDPIRELTKTEDQNSVLWARTDSGQLYGVTLDRDYQINAWFRYVAGRAPEDTLDVVNGGYVGIVTVCAHPEDTNNYGALYMLTVRSVDGADRMFLEVTQPPWELGNPFDTAFDASAVAFAGSRYPVYLDCAQVLTKAGATATTSFNTKTANANPYRNTTVAVVADGNDVGDFLVADDANGTLTLTTAANVIVVGHRYPGKLQTTPIQQGGTVGPAMGRIKRIDEMVVKFFSTVGATFGYPGQAQESIEWAEVDQPADQGIRYFTGEKVVNYPSDYARDISVVIEQDGPYPCHVLAIVPRAVTYD